MNTKTKTTKNEALLALIKHAADMAVSPDNLKTFAKYVGQWLKTNRPDGFTAKEQIERDRLLFWQTLNDLKEKKQSRARALCPNCSKGKGEGAIRLQ